MVSSKYFDIGNKEYIARSNITDERNQKVLILSLDVFNFINHFFTN